MVGPRGQMTTHKGRQYYYTCDLGANGRLRQTRLPFAVETTSTRDDTEQEEVKCSDTTVGQRENCEE